MGIEPLLSGLARVWSIGVDSDCCEGLPESRPGESDLSVGDGKRAHPRCPARNASAARSKPISTSANPRWMPTSSVRRISSAIPPHYRGIEKKHYPAIARTEQDIVGSSEGACQIYALCKLGFRPASQAQGSERPHRRNSDRPVRIAACVAHQSFDWKPESAQGLGPHVMKLRFSRVRSSACRSAWSRMRRRRHGITDRDLAGPDARARST
jgi:hypothetical protein